MFDTVITALKERKIVEIIKGREKLTVAEKNRIESVFDKSYLLSYSYWLKEYLSKYIRIEVL